MRIKGFSWFLAAAILIFGLSLFKLTTGFETMFTSIGVPEVGMRRVVNFIGPSGWLVLAVTGAFLVALKDLKFRSPFLNPVFAAVLILTYAAVFLTVVFPFFGPVDYIRP